MAVMSLVIADEHLRQKQLVNPQPTHGYRVDMELPLGSWVNEWLIVAMVTAAFTRWRKKPAGFRAGSVAKLSEQRGLSGSNCRRDALRFRIRAA
jgi:hypothetical protein